MITILSFISAGLLSRDAADACSSGPLFLQSRLHPCAEELLRMRPDSGAMDDLYETCEGYDDLNAAIAARVVGADGSAYAMLGTLSEPQLAAIREAADRKGVSVRVIPGPSLSGAAFAAEPAARVHAAHALPDAFDANFPCAVEEVDSALIAGEVKLRLMEYWPDGWQVKTARFDHGAFLTETVPLYMIDRLPAYDASTCLYLSPVPFEKRERFGFDDLTRVLIRLRDPADGCPWDKVQTHESLRKDLLEEAYELYDAIGEGDDFHMQEELGDVLMHVLFHCVIGMEQDSFSPRDVTTGIVRKLIFRHPHIFGDVIANTPEQVLRNWEDLKMEEKGQTTETEALRSVTKGLPALMYAKKIQKKAAHVGFDWASADEAFCKIGEETAELREAMNSGTNIAEETGDLLFAVVNVARLLHLEPELLLREAAEKFTERFARMESLAIADGRQLKGMTLGEMDAYWDKAKAEERKQH